MGLIDGWRRLVGLVRRRPAGPMRQYAWPRYSRRRLLESEYLTADVVGVVRAYPVPGLIDALVEAPTEAELPDAIEVLLHRLLPPFDWQVASPVNLALRKYGIVHTSLEAPPDAGEPMWLELAAETVTLDGRSVAGGTWIDLRGMSSDDRLDTEVPGPIRVKVTAASYGNIRFLGVDMPFYA